jgi:hypothetical protein
VAFLDEEQDGPVRIERPNARRLQCLGVVAEQIV